jgi:hypothetical protein
LGAFEFLSLNLGKRKLRLERLAGSVAVEMLAPTVEEQAVEDGNQDAGPVVALIMEERAAENRPPPKKKAKRRNGGFVNRWRL